MHHQKVIINTQPSPHLLLAVGYVADVAPGEGLVWVELAVGAVDVETLGVHAEQQVSVSLVLLSWIIWTKTVRMQVINTRTGWLWICGR